MSAPTKKPSEKQINVATPAHPFPKVMFFNRFYFERTAGAMILFFGMVDANDVVRDSFACAIDDETIEQHKEELLKFAARFESENEPGGEWRPKASYAGGVRVANVIRGARRGSLGEIRLLNYSIGDALESIHESNPSIDAFPVALLRCEANLQRELFLSLYATNS
jgi:hypothetical protein